MRVLARIGIGRVVAVVRGNQLQATEDFRRVSIIYNVNTLADVFFRHTVMMLEECDVAVLQYRIRPALLCLEPGGGKRLQIVTLSSVKKLLPELVAPGQPTSVEAFQ